LFLTGVTSDSPSQSQILAIWVPRATHRQTAACRQPSAYANLRGVTDEPNTISIALSPAQVAAVVRAATHSRAPSVSLLIGNALRAPGSGELLPAGGPDERDGRLDAADLDCDEDDADPRMSRSLMRGLSLLTRFGPDGSERGIVELSRELGMSPSTTHRYASTLVELGLLERSSRTRKYRLPSVL
jgi:hypothetical protein